jgi:hypothetical protein
MDKWTKNLNNSQKNRRKSLKMISKSYSCFFLKEVIGLGADGGAIGSLLITPMNKGFKAASV